eukprot:s2214_g6.t1
MPISQSYQFVLHVCLNVTANVVCAVTERERSSSMRRCLDRRKERSRSPPYSRDLREGVLPACGNTKPSTMGTAVHQPELHVLYASPLDQRIPQINIQGELDMLEESLQKAKCHMSIKVGTATTKTFAQLLTRARSTGGIILHLSVHVVTAENGVGLVFENGFGGAHILYRPQLEELLGCSQQLDGKQAEEKQEAGAPTSPPKKQRTADEEDLAEFERKLTELDINFGDLDPELQNRLRSSTSSSFLKDRYVSCLSTMNPEDGTWMPQAIAKKREFGAITGCDVPDITAEANVQAAMMKYHEKSILPSHLVEIVTTLPKMFMAQHEFALTQYSLERQAAQIQTLERARANKTVLLMDLPPIYSKKVLDNNMQYYLQLANLSWDTVAAVHNHMVTGNFAHFGGAGGIHHGDAGHDLPRQHATRAPLLAHRRRQR